MTPSYFSPSRRLQEQAAFFGIFGSLMDRTSGALEVLRAEGKLLGLEAEGGEATAGGAKGQQPSLKSSSEKQRKKEGSKRKAEALEKDGKKSKKDKKLSKSQGAPL